MRTALFVLGIVVSVAQAIDVDGGEELIVEPPRPPLQVSVWTDRGERAVYYPGERIRIYFRATQDAHVVVYDVDTEGRVKLLFPPDPFHGTWITGGRTYVLPPQGVHWDLRISGPAGIEYVVIVASTSPFEWDEYAERLASGGVLETITTDPQLGIERINQLIAPTYEGVPYYVSARTSFYVERRVPYPRYMCYDCHSPWHWDPYYAICPAFEIVIYSRWDDYYYRPPYNPWGRRPYYWYKRKANREYPTVKYKYAEGRSFWEGRTKKAWVYPAAPPTKEKREEHPRPAEGTRWKNTPPERPVLPEILVKHPSVLPERPASPAPERAKEDERGKATPQEQRERTREEPRREEKARSTPREQPLAPEIQTRPFYRERETKKQEARQDSSRNTREKDHGSRRERHSGS